MNFTYLWVGISIMGLMSSLTFPEIPHEFFIDSSMQLQVTIVVGERAASMDVAAATSLATALGSISSPEKDPLLSAMVSYAPDLLFPGNEVSEKIEKMGTPVVFVPDGRLYGMTDLVTSFFPLQYFDDPHGFWGTGDNTFQPWETHEEIQLWSRDVTSPCEICLYGGDIPLFREHSTVDLEYFLSLSGMIYRIDNIFAPPVIMIESKYIEPFNILFAWDPNPYRKIFVPEPWMVMQGRLPHFTLHDTVYTVVDAGPILDIDKNIDKRGPMHGKPSLLTGIPHYEPGILLHKDEPREYGRYSLVLRNILSEKNSAEMELYSFGELIEAFELVLNPEEGFLAEKDSLSFPLYDSYEDLDRDDLLDPQELSSDYTFYDFDSDGIEDFRKWIVDSLSQDMYCKMLWESYTSESFNSYILSGYPVLVLDGVDICENGQEAWVNIYWIENPLFWYPRSCANPWFEDENYQIYFDAYESGWSLAPQGTLLYQPPGTGLWPEKGFERWHDPEYIGNGFLDCNDGYRGWEYILLEELSLTHRHPEYSLFKEGESPDIEDPVLWHGPGRLILEINIAPCESVRCVESVNGPLRDTIPFFTLTISDEFYAEHEPRYIINLQKSFTLPCNAPPSIEVSNLIVVDGAISFQEWRTTGTSNLILIGGPVANTIVDTLVKEGISTVNWFDSDGEWEYISDLYACDILIIAGKDREATCQAVAQFLSTY
ncbi:MAG: S-layer protein [Theionarchaea archaeon]|nr:S-layer protein [Theionarchaea archaeon]